MSEGFMWMCPLHFLEEESPCVVNQAFSLGAGNTEWFKWDYMASMSSGLSRRYIWIEYRPKGISPT